MEIFREKEFYQERIAEMVEKINNTDSLKQIYELAQYLYIHKEKME